jgi:hypothetical protein
MGPHPSNKIADMGHLLVRYRPLQFEVRDISESVTVGGGLAWDRCSRACQGSSRLELNHQLPNNLTKAV